MRTQTQWFRGSESDPAEGARRAQTVQTHIESAGERLTVTTPAAYGHPAVTRQIAFLPQPISASTLTRLQYEGIINIAGGMTMDFVCAGDAGVAIGDLIGPYDGTNWQVLGTPPERYAGVTLTRHVIAQRQ